jgi:quinol monooxygenase YgiN
MEGTAVMAKSSLFIVIGEFAVNPENHGRVVEMLLENRRQTLATEEGCRSYEVCTTEDHEPSRIYMVESYDSRAAFEAHKTTPHFAVWEKNGAPLIRELGVTFLKRNLMLP